MPCNDHAEKATALACTILDIVQGVAGRLRLSRLSVRCGVATGDVTAAVVGSSLPRYLVYGDTCEKAGVLESSARPGQAFISEETRSRISDEWMVHDGSIEVPNKGRCKAYHVLLSERNRKAMVTGEQGERLQALLELFRRNKQSTAKGVAVFNAAVSPCSRRLVGNGTPTVQRVSTPKSSGLDVPKGSHLLLAGLGSYGVTHTDTKSKASMDGSSALAKPPYPTDMPLPAHQRSIDSTDRPLPVHRRSIVSNIRSWVVKCPKDSLQRAVLEEHGKGSIQGDGEGLPGRESATYQGQRSNGDGSNGNCSNADCSMSDDSDAEAHGVDGMGNWHNDNNADTDAIGVDHETYSSPDDVQVEEDALRTLRFWLDEMNSDWTGTMLVRLLCTLLDLFSCAHLA